jgi:ring-1,2-phenylacetyl-CoA epoxidase subunit PaaC
VSYHRDHAARWVVRLGDGTPLSHDRMQAALAAVWPFVDELFRPHPVELRLAAAEVGTDPFGLRTEFDDVIAAVLAEATLELPDVAPMAGVPSQAGRDGVHTEAMPDLLAELQSVARAHPGATW